MKPLRVVFCLAVLLGLLPSALAIVAEEKPKTIEMDKPVPFDFKLKTGDGETEYTLSQFKGKILVIEFMATRCPYSLGQDPVIRKICEDYSKKGVAFLGINSNRQEPAEEVASHQKEKKLGFPVVKDWNNVVADLFKGTNTPHIFVIDAKGLLRYEGAIEPRKGEKTPYLRNALDDLLAGKEVRLKKTQQWGCTIKRVPGVK
jgi:thiol-disulfide isomerase/thioredoxin